MANVVVLSRPLPRRPLHLTPRETLAKAEDREANELITLLAGALEKVVETTSDDAARELAADALAIFQGRY